MAITTSTRRGQAKPVKQTDKEQEVKNFYTEPIREEFAELTKTEKKKRPKNPNKAEFVMSIDKELLKNIDADAKEKEITRVAWMVRAAKNYLGNEDKY